MSAPLVRRLLHRAGDLAFVPPLDRYWVRAMRGRVTCFLYHRVDDPASHRFLTDAGLPLLPPDVLRDELRFLLGLGAVFLTFADLRVGRFPSAREAGVIVSFDDCFRDNFTTGAEVLRSLGVPGMFFQSTAMLGAPSLLWEHALYWATRDAPARARFTAAAHRELGTIPGVAERAGRELATFLRESVDSTVVEAFLERAGGELDLAEGGAAAAQQLYPSAGLLRDASAEGHEVGSHGHRHYKRATVPTPVFEEDLATSLRVLESCLGTRPEAYSYPFNSYLPGDDVVCARHVSQAVTVDKRRIEADTDPFWLPRFTSPGQTRNAMRFRRWLLRGQF